MSIQLHPNIQISHFSSSGETPEPISQTQFLIQCEHLNYVVSAPVKALIECLIAHQQSGKSLTDSYFSLTQRRTSEDDLIALAQQHIPKELFAEAELPAPRNPFVFSMTLIPERLLRHISVCLTPLFNKWLSIVIALLFFSIHAVVLSQTNYITASSIPINAIPLFILAMLLSYFIHELGHISACRRFQCPHGDIGFGIYLIFPVFYADVSKAWRLTQKQRAIVDLGGLYFQSILIIGIDCYAYIYNSSFAYILSWTITLTMLHTLNPFFKFDGYWLLSDISGITNLHEKMRIAIGQVKGKLFHGLPLNFKQDKALYLLIPYSIMAMMFFMYVATFLLRKLWLTGQDIISAISTLPNDDWLEILSLATQQGTLWPLLKALLWAALLVLLLSFYAKRISNLLFQSKALNTETTR